MAGLQFRQITEKTTHLEEKLGKTVILRNIFGAGITVELIRFFLNGRIINIYQIPANNLM